MHEVTGIILKDKIRHREIFKLTQTIGAVNFVQYVLYRMGLALYVKESYLPRIVVLRFAGKFIRNIVITRAI